MVLFRILILLLATGIVSCKENGKDEPVASSRAESEIDKVKLTNLNNSPVDLKIYHGKTVFINFWATWCKPCLLEMPSIQNAKEVLKNENIEFLFASDESVDQIEWFKSKHKYDFNYVRAENMAELNIAALPATFIFNPKGKLVFSEMGYRKWDDNNNIDMILKIIKTK
jgi:thiol-disulfide isomerase/thioredoxin